MNKKTIIAITILSMIVLSGCVVETEKICQSKKACYKYGNGLTRDKQISCNKEWDYYLYVKDPEDKTICLNNNTYERLYD
jgi:hypothetical protein